MRFWSLRQAGLAALILAGLLVACDDNPPTAPTPPPQPPVPQAPPSPALTRLEVAGPASVPPGETARSTATASFADGSTRDVTAQSTWRIQPSCCPTPSSMVLSISPRALPLATTGVRRLSLLHSAADRPARRCWFCPQERSCSAAAFSTRANRRPASESPSSPDPRLGSRP